MIKSGFKTYVLYLLVKQRACTCQSTRPCSEYSHGPEFSHVGTVTYHIRNLIPMIEAREIYG
jgi:hypothetical protein